MGASRGVILLSCLAILKASYTVILLSCKTYPLIRGEVRGPGCMCLPHHSTDLDFVPCIFMYLRPATTSTEDKMMAVFYTIITPMLNPLIYTLRNTKLKNATNRLWFKMLLGRNRKDPEVELSGVGTASVMPVSKGLLGIIQTSSLKSCLTRNGVREYKSLKSEDLVWTGHPINY